MMPAPEYVYMLNEKCQKARKTAEYTTQREGPKHDETWTLTVFIDQIQHGQGTGKTKDSAKAAAAKMALETLSGL